ncbi:type II secretion system F family protein [Acidimangrovimonas sediminis]|uniref:type II secretion system F family protein n=1 Tax=Acidimangrovimonas sediminis TaxID=2056283 RepID=UPI000C8068AB|nr:type II secretion system F family protein [Acidimangrovimonas sediminis]
MGLAVLFMIMAAAGVALLSGAIVLYVVGAITRQRDRIAARYAGEVEVEAGTEAPAGVEGPQMGLLIPAERGGLMRSLTGLLPDAVQAFRADLPRLFWPGLGCAVLGVGFALMRLLGLPLIWTGLLTLLIVGAGLFFWIRLHDRRRRTQIDMHLPEALDIISRCLKIGMPVSAALRMVGHDLTGSIAREFLATADQINYGKEMPAALHELATRCDSMSLRFFAAAVAIQAETGGNLVEVVERLSRLTRERIQLRRKIDAMTSEAKWSGRFLSFFPIAAVVGIMLINPDYFSNLQNSPYLMPMAIGGGLMLGLNIVFMNRLVQFE